LPGEIAVLLGGVLAFQHRASQPAVIVAAVAGVIIVNPSVLPATLPVTAEHVERAYTTRPPPTCRTPISPGRTQNPPGAGPGSFIASDGSWKGNLGRGRRSYESWTIPFGRDLNGKCVDS
jgi:hypothetical protein